MANDTRSNYRDIKEIILERLQDGTWPAGSYLPGEIELAEEFGCARTTINRALRELANEGLLSRKRKAGTRVEEAPSRSATFKMPSIRHEVEEMGAEYRFFIAKSELTAAPRWLSGRLNSPDLGKLLYLHSVHYANNQPFQFEERWIVLETVPDAEFQTFDGKLMPSEWLLKVKPFSDVELTFTATRADKMQAEYLGIPLNEPVLVGERATWFKGEPVTFARMCHAPGYKMVTRY